MSSARVIVISPHCDDAAFALAATLKGLATAECSVRIINCFTLSRFAPYLDSRDEAYVSARRREEDASFVALLGARGSSLDLGLLDAPTRTGLGVRAILVRDSTPTGAPATTQTLIERFEEHEADVPVLIPLGLGGHIDHCLARDAAILKYRNCPVAFYEDLPYAATENPQRFEACVAHISATLGVALSAVTANWPGGSEWKRQCCSLYRSQISENGVRKIIGYMTRINGERLWTTSRFLESMAGHRAILAVNN